MSTGEDLGESKFARKLKVVITGYETFRCVASYPSRH